MKSNAKWSECTGKPCWSQDFHTFQGCLLHRQHAHRRGDYPDSVPVSDATCDHLVVALQGATPADVSANSPCRKSRSCRPPQRGDAEPESPACLAPLSHRVPPLQGRLRCQRETRSRRLGCGSRPRPQGPLVDCRIPSALHSQRASAAGCGSRQGGGRAARSPQPARAVRVHTQARGGYSAPARCSRRAAAAPSPSPPASQGRGPRSRLRAATCRPFFPAASARELQQRRPGLGLQLAWPWSGGEPGRAPRSPSAPLSNRPAGVDVARYRERAPPPAQTPSLASDSVGTLSAPHTVRGCCEPPAPSPAGECAHLESGGAPRHVPQFPPRPGAKHRVAPPPRARHQPPPPPPPPASILTTQEGPLTPARRSLRARPTEGE